MSNRQSIGRFKPPMRSSCFEASLDGALQFRRAHGQGFKNSCAVARTQWHSRSGFRIEARITQWQARSGSTIQAKKTNERNARSQLTTASAGNDFVTSAAKCTHYAATFSHDDPAQSYFHCHLSLRCQKFICTKYNIFIPLPWLSIIYSG